MKVSLFITCMCDIFSANVGKDTIEVLERFGCEVDFPEAQTCCGQPAYNSGYLTNTKETMKHMMKVFRDSSYIVGPSGSCVAMLRSYKDIFRGDAEWEELAEKFSAKSFELSQFLVDVLGIVDVGSTFTGRVTYHPSCHMTRLLGVKDAPMQLLNQVKGVDLVKLPHGEDCCGFGGTFAVKNAVISGQMVQEKAVHVMETEAEFLVGGDMACLMNIGGRLSREGRNVKVIHLAEILNHR